ncbi:MAG: hypothetical protein OXC63_07195 [Aestuariivita sp.]|nr:hypothetical protein [Aestuariivita sp.]MCY4346396.1 hypothetical protein [Aestuariivita sp.]
MTDQAQHEIAPAYYASSAGVMAGNNDVKLIFFDSFPVFGTGKNVGD